MGLQPRSDARGAATSAAARAGCVVRPLEGAAEARAASALFDRVWGGEGILPATLVRAIGHAGGYAVGAWDHEALVGASVAFLGAEQRLHSQITGALPARQGGGVGFALKQHQRWWCLERGITTVTWTFDPLMTRNACFNLRKLGAVVNGFEPDFYGPMDDAYNADDATDRCVVTWLLDSDRAATAAEGGSLPSPDVSAATTLLDRDERGGPRLCDPAGAAVLRARVGDDHLALRRTDPAAARAWRLAFRQAVGGAIREGYVAVDADRDGWWTLVRGDEEVWR
ncbi:MAG: GNAT family N-acetyltransferase [Actinobacteria bacterium]|nr:GNAT family N-acetyltransferase [Actinomycetota bacterium]